MKEFLEKYFEEISDVQKQQLEALPALYKEWNSKINVVSRKDIDNLALHHILHSLAIAKVIQFKPGTKILDVGTGGGFPGIPLAILFPGSHFTLLDSVAKKLKVVDSIAESLNISNVSTIHQRVEKTKSMYDFVVSRAVTALPDFYQWVKAKINSHSKNELKNGILYLKGGDFTEELLKIRAHSRVYDLDKFFTESYFETKKLVYIF